MARQLFLFLPYLLCFEIKLLLATDKGDNNDWTVGSDAVNNYSRDDDDERDKAV